MAKGSTSRSLHFFLQFLWPGSSSNTAGNTLVLPHTELFFHCLPCCCLRRHLQKPSLLFIKPLKNKQRPQDTPVKAEPRPAHTVLLGHTSERGADLHEGPFVCGSGQWQK